MNRTAELKIELLCNGIRCEEGVAPKEYPKGGKSRAGVAGSGKNFVVNPKREDEFVVNAGVLQPFLEISPFEFRRVDGKGWILRNGKKVCRATIFEPKWHSMRVGEIVRLHGTSSLAIALTNVCMFKQNGLGCKFCIIDIGNLRVTHRPEEIANAIAEIEKTPEIRKYRDFDGMEGIVEPEDVNINSGTLEEKVMIKMYSETAKSIRKVSDLPIGIEIAPIEKESMMELKDAGIDSIYINIEVFSEQARKSIITGKNALFSKEKYLRAMENAVSIFGENQVASWILIGLESVDETIKGIEAIAEAGAIPLPRAFRPLFHSELETHPPPSVEDAKTVYSSWLEIVKLYGLDPMKTIAGCIKCGACFPIREILG